MKYIGIILNLEYFVVVDDDEDPAGDTGDTSRDNNGDGLGNGRACFINSIIR